MKHNVSPSTDDLHGWENEIFDDFVLDVTESTTTDVDAKGAGGGFLVEDVDDDFPIANLDKLKEALSMLTSATEMPAEEVAATPAKQIVRPSMQTIDCPELAEAYLEDASRGIGALDQAVIDYESNSKRDEALRQILRELHTLKGASAAVGLADLSHYLHEIEDVIECEGQSAEAITDALLTCLDCLREQSSALHAGDLAKTNRESSAEPSLSLEPSSEGEDSIQVKGAQLDRLLDMVTSLTMLNNQRDSHVDQLRSLNAYVNQCGNRLRDLERMLSKTPAFKRHVDPIPSISTSMLEVGSDLDEISQLLRSSYSPISNEHLAVTNFTQQFRHALVSILRMPVSGMFRRLQRAALDAARVEEKQVRLEVIGSDSGLERSVQERLLDPLMHIVRNAVSHGIEGPGERKKCGKDPVGTITLEAISAPNLLTLNVRDDGKGLDYEALRRRGTQLGLLQDRHEPTHQELAQLIFQPGFSTRDEANEVAGRGVGMDVVADTLEKLHAWAEVESVPGQGMTIKLTVPLKSITEHVLIVRVGEHLAALPMQHVRSVDDSSGDDTTHPQLAQVLGLPGSNMAKTELRLQWIPNRYKIGSDANSTCCLVDEILGSQEVVVRPLPPLLRHQPFLAGVTLSATGDVVYVLDPRQVAAAVDQAVPGAEFQIQPVNVSNDKPATVKILVVDDSLSARRAVAMCCRERGWEPIEAENGIEGLELIDQENWTAIITDFDMPQMDGIQFIKALRSRDSMRRVPILMASSRVSGEMAAKAIAAGATNYVSKPVTLQVLDKFLSLHSTIKRMAHG